MDNINNNIASTGAVAPIPSSGDKKPVGAAVAITICAILAVAGVGFGVYTFADSNQKNQQIANLEASVNTKDLEIAKLETRISLLESDATEATPETESADSTPAPEKADGTASITLGPVISESDTRTTFKISDCTADGPSVKCDVEINGKQGLISYVTTDSILRLTMPKE